MDIILKKPLVTEKSMKQAGSGWYTFLVEKSATKPLIARAVEEQFKVEVVAVGTMNFKELKKLQKNRRGYFIQAGFKKALVALKKGQKIALFETKEEPKEEKGKKEVKEKRSLFKGTKVKIEKDKGEK